MKKLWFDTETTGIDSYKNDIVQIAGLIEINGEIVEEFNIKCQPRNWESISDEALGVTGLTLTDLKSYQAPGYALNQLIKIFDKHISKFDKADKFTPCGHNVKFDLDMLQSFFKKGGEKYGTGAYQNWAAIDTLSFARIVDDIIGLNVENHKLETLCNKFNITIDAHDALSDIKATRLVYKELQDFVADYYMGCVPQGEMR